MSIGQASVFKFNKTGKYLIYCNSMVEMGVSIATEPFIKLEALTPFDEIVCQIQYAMSCSKTNLPNPTDWNSFNKKYLQAIGLKSTNDLYKDTICVGALIKDDIITFTPMINNGSKGFVNVPNEKIEISANSSIEDISQALKHALDMCK
jgi:hypothetical protein